MQERLFQAEEFGIATRATASIMFICPYDTPIQKVRFALRRLLRAGAAVTVHEVPAVSHRTTVIVGLWKAPRLVRMVRQR
jgi:hypothetical protein